MDVGVAGFEMKEQLEMTPEVFDFKIESVQPIFKSPRAFAGIKPVDVDWYGDINQCDFIF